MIRKFICAASVICLLGTTTTTGQEQPIRLDRVQVEPAQLTTLLKTGDLVPIDTKELDRRIREVNENLQPATEAIADQIKYEASVTDDGILQGTFDATFGQRKTSSQSSLLFMGRSDFDSFEPKDGTVWGLDSNANVVVISNAGLADNVTGNWTLKGQTRAWGTEFSFRPMAALASELLLRLPATLRLQSSTALVQAQDTDATGTLWRVIPDGGNVATKFSVVRSETASKPGSPLVDVRTTWTLLPENTSFQADYSIQSTVPVTDFSVRLPEGCTEESVTYGDSGTLPIEIQKTASGRVLRVQLPTPLQGAGLAVRIRGRTPMAAGSNWTVPDLDTISCGTSGGRIANAVARRVTQRILVQAPLELQQLKLDGYRQTDSVFDLNGSQTISLERVFANARTTLRVNRAQRARQYQVITRLMPESEVWKHRVLIIPDTPLPGEVTLSLPANFTVLAINVGQEQTPCDFRLEGNSQAPTVRVFVPPTGSSLLELNGHTKAPPLSAIRPLDGTLVTHRMVVPSDSLGEPLTSMSTISASQLRSSLPGNLSAGFVPPGSIVVEARPGMAISLKPTNVAVPLPESGPEPETELRLTELVLPLELTSSLHHRPAPDTHVAKITAGNQPTLTFELATDASLTAVRVNNVKARYERDGSTITVPLDMAANKNVVEVRYESSGKPSYGLTSQRTIPTPQLATTGPFVWSLEVPDNTNLVRTEPFGQQSTVASQPLLNLLGPLYHRPNIEPLGIVQFPFAPQRLEITVCEQGTVRTFAWIAMSATLLICVGLLRFVSPVWLCVVEALLALLCFVLSGPGGTICGGCLLGGLIALVLSKVVRKPLAATPVPPTAHDLSAVRLTMLLAIGVFGAAEYGSSLVNASQAENDTNTFRVLEIEGQNLVYVQKRLLDVLDKATPETSGRGFLLRDATYAVNYSRDSCTVVATLSVLVPPGSDTAVVAIPLANANVGLCRIDGNKSLYSKQGNDVLIPIPKAPEQEEDEQKDEQEQQNKATQQVVRIELELHPPAIDGRCVFRVPETRSSTCLVTSDVASALVLNDQDIRMGQAYPVNNRIELSARQADPTQVDTSATFANACTIEIGPSETTIEHRLVVTPGSTPLEMLDLTFPATHEFISLTATVPAKQQVLRGTSQSYVALNFEQPVIAPIEIKLKLTSTNAATANNRAIELRPLVSDTQDDQVAITSRPGLRIEKISIESSDGSTDPATEPRVVPVVTDGPTTTTIAAAGLLRFSLTSPPPTREVFLKQRVRVTADQLEYSLEADLQILNGPVFSHTLTVNDDLIIETIAVSENGVDRLARYQRDGGQLLLLLEGRTSGLQNIQIEGRIPRTIDSLSSIPGVEVESARVMESTLVLETTDDIEASLENAGGIPFAVRADGALTDSLETGRATFQLLKQTQLPLVRTRLRTPPSIEAICFLQPTADPTRPNYLWAFRIDADSPGAELTVDLNGTNLIAHDGDNDSHGALVTSAAMGVSTIRLPSGTGIVTATLPGQGETVPTIDWPTTVTTSKPILVIPKHSGYTVQASLEVDQPLPKWATTFAAGKQVRLFVGNASNWQLTSPSLAVAATDGSGESIAAARVDTTVRQQGSKTAGTTTIVPATDAGELRVKIPAGINIQSVQLDNRLSDEHRIDGTTLTIPVTRPSTIIVRWQGTVRSEEFLVPFPTLLLGEAFFVVHTTATGSSVDSSIAATISQSDYQSRRTPEFSGLTDSLDNASILSLVSQSTTTLEPSFRVLSAESATPMIGIGFLAGIVVFAICLSTQYVGTGIRAAAVLMTLGLFLIIATDMPAFGALLLATAPVTWWFVPREM